MQGLDEKKSKSKALQNKIHGLRHKVSQLKYFSGEKFKNASLEALWKMVRNRE